MASLVVCQNCGASVSPTNPQGIVTSDDVADDAGVDQLVSEGFDRDAVIRVKRMVRSYVLRLRFRQVAMDFKNHKASLLMRLRNEALREIYTSEKKYVDALQLCLVHFYQPLVRISNAKGSRIVISRQQLADIFSTLEIIVELNRGLLVDLESRL